jgi:hypothetical protein
MGRGVFKEKQISADYSSVAAKRNIGTIAWKQNCWAFWYKEDSEPSKGEILLAPM